MKMIAGILLLTALTDCAFMADKSKVPEKYAGELTAEQLRTDLTIVAADSMEGRRTGLPGQKKAAAYLAGMFQQIGLAPQSNGSFFQQFDLYSHSVENAFVKIRGTRYDNYSDIIYSGSTDTKGEVSLEVVFVGRGSSADYEHMDVNNKAVCLVTPLPQSSLSAAFREWSDKAIKKGAKMVFIIPEGEDFSFLGNRIRTYTSSGKLSLNKPAADETYKGVFLISPLAAERLFKTKISVLIGAAHEPAKHPLNKFKSARVIFGATVRTSVVKTENIAGMLEGTDKKEEVVVITAHYDHIGMTANGEDHINNGADDDGSGTVAVLEIARAFARAKADGNGPRRSLLFLMFSAEEQGLLGSEYYANHPLYPLSNTIVDLNIDMIGRTDLEHGDSVNYVYVIGSDKLSSELHELSEKTNATYTGLRFDYSYNDENHPTNLYKRSDHWNFAKNGIPVIFYFDGIHEDYHKPSDEVSKIDFDLLRRRAQCIFYTGWEVAHRESTIRPDKK